MSTFDRAQTGKSPDERKAAREARSKGLPSWLQPVPTPAEEAASEYARYGGKYQPQEACVYCGELHFGPCFPSLP